MVQAASGGALLAAMAPRSGSAQTSKELADTFPDVTGLTRQVAEFIARTTATDLPGEVIELGKKSLLDSLGLALCGSRSAVGKLAHAYVATQGLPDRECDGDRFRDECSAPVRRAFLTPSASIAMTTMIPSSPWEAIASTGC